ncbi:MAG: amidase [Pseudomonadota bacterium]
MTEITRWSAVETVARLRARTVTAAEVTQAHLDRLAAVNPDLNAVVDAVPDAMDRARAIDRGEIAPGLLHGAPVTTKINADQAGLANTNGLPVQAGNIAPAHSAVVGNLMDAGAVVIGRTNTPEMSLRWCTSNPLHGTTLNPWDARITPGGSSGGASASLAAGIGVLAHGNDLGGSIRYPAHCCGLVGLRPSLGRVPAFNPSAPAERPPMTMLMSVQGPLGRSVADVALGLHAMQGHSGDDPMWSAAAASGGRRGPVRRVGVAAGGFGTVPAPDVAEAMRRAARAAEDAGLEVVPVDLPAAERCAELWGQLLFTETEGFYAEFLRQHGSEDLQRWLEAFRTYFQTLELQGYMEAIAERGVHQRAWAHLLSDVDALIMPVSLIPPFENDLDFKDPSAGPTLIDAQKPLCVINFLGLPSCALPTHVAGGIPQGVQVVGAMHDDVRVLNVAEALERELGSILGDLPEPYGVVS